MAGVLGRLQDLPGAARALTRLVEEEPESIKPRIQLFDLALQSKQPEAAEAQVRAIAKLDEQVGLFCRAKLLISQAQGAAAGAREKLWGQARGLLNELKAAPPGLVPDPPGPGPAERAGDGSRGTG